MDEINYTLHSLHPSDAAEFLSNLPEKSRFDLLSIEKFQLKADIIVEFNNALQKDILNNLPTQEVVNIVNELESDNALQIVSNLNEFGTSENIDGYALCPPIGIELSEGISAWWLPVARDIFIDEPGD